MNEVNRKEKISRKNRVDKIFRSNLDVCVLCVCIQEKAVPLVKGRSSNILGVMMGCRRPGSSYWIVASKCWNGRLMGHCRQRWRRRRRPIRRVRDFLWRSADMAPLWPFFSPHSSDVCEMSRCVETIALSQLYSSHHHSAPPYTSCRLAIQSGWLTSPRRPMADGGRGKIVPQREMVEGGR